MTTEGDQGPMAPTRVSIRCVRSIHNLGDGNWSIVYETSKSPGSQLTGIDVDEHLLYSMFVDGDFPIDVVTDTEKTEDLTELLYEAWCVIANTGHEQGGWSTQHPEWITAAERWRDRWHATLPSAQRGHECW